MRYFDVTVEKAKFVQSYDRMVEMNRGFPLSDPIENFTGIIYSGNPHATFAYIYLDGMNGSVTQYDYDRLVSHFEDLLRTALFQRGLLPDGIHKVSTFVP